MPSVAQAALVCLLSKEEHLRGVLALMKLLQVFFCCTPITWSQRCPETRAGGALPGAGLHPAAGDDLLLAF